MKYAKDRKIRKGKNMQIWKEENKGRDANYSDEKWSNPYHQVAPLDPIGEKRRPMLCMLMMKTNQFSKSFMCIEAQWKVKNRIWTKGQRDGATVPREAMRGNMEPATRGSIASRSGAVSDSSLGQNQWKTLKLILRFGEIYDCNQFSKIKFFTI